MATEPSSTDFEVIQSPDAPAAIGPYSHAVRVGGLLFCSGQVPIDPATGELVDGDFTAQVDRSLRNLQAVVQAAGADLSRVVKLTLFLTDLGNFAQANEVMKQYFTAPFPARSTIGVASLPKGAQFEVEAVIAVG